MIQCTLYDNTSCQTNSAFAHSSKDSTSNVRNKDIEMYNEGLAEVKDRPSLTDEVDCSVPNEAHLRTNSDIHSEDLSISMLFEDGLYNVSRESVYKIDLSNAKIFRIS